MTTRDVTVPIVDAHHHLWDVDAAEYPWMTGAYEVLRRTYGPADLAPILAAAGITATVVVQARHDLDETRTLLATATATPWLVGVVGWVDLTSPTVADTLAGLRAEPGGERLVGVRHLVHDEPDPGWLVRDDVLRGLAAVADAGLSYDLLVRSRELPAAVAVAERLPGLRLVLDHLAKPPIVAGDTAPWAVGIEQLAARPNVVCKVSGLVTEADWSRWTPADLAPSLAVAVERFGPDRLMWGSDWPVCTLAARYEDVLSSTVDVMTDLVGGDLGSLLGGCAAATYGLDALVDES